jgi:polyisoprenoid-binding protein YceI
MKYLFLVFFAPSAFAAVQNLTSNGGAVEFLAIGKPSFIKINGKGSPPTGTLALDGEKVSGKFEFDLTSLDTGMATRNDHMKTKYLEVGKFPKASLEVTSVKSLKGWSLKTPKLDQDSFEGSLTLHGVTKPVSGRFTVSDKGHVDAKFKLKMTDYNVAIPSFAGVTVTDEVEVTVQLEKLDAT